MDKFKKDIIDLMNSTSMCESSILRVERCSTLLDMVTVLGFYATNLETPFPTIEMIRKHYSDRIDELNQVGVYLDQEAEIVPLRYTIAYNSHLKCRIEAPKMKIFILNSSFLDIEAKDFSLANIFASEDSDTIINTDKYAKICLKRYQ